MKLIKKGKKPPIWRGSCKYCAAEFEDTDENVRNGSVEHCFREHYEFAHRDCPECHSNFGVTLYVIKPK